MELIKQLGVTKIAEAAASAGTVVASDIIDTANYDGVIFVTSVAVANAGNNVAIQHNSVNSTDGMAALAGGTVVIADANQMVVVAVHKPRKRFLRAVITRGGTNTATGQIYAILYRARKAPTPSGAVALVSPADA